MSGGTFVTQSKKRPGAYINFKSVPKPTTSIGERGVAVLPVVMDWGPELEVFELLSVDLSTGAALVKIGYGAEEAESLIFRQLLSNAYKGLIYRLNSNGVKASKVMGNLTSTAKYSGVRGNDLSVAIIANGAKFDVVTYLEGTEKNRQTVSTVAGLVANDWIDFSGEGVLVATAAASLTGGTNGAVGGTAFSDFIPKITGFIWNTMAIVDATYASNAAVTQFVKNMRDGIGKKIQVVLIDTAGAGAANTSDHEGIISVFQGYKTATETINPKEFAAYVAGLTAGTAINKSNTYFEIPGATDIVTPLAETAIEAALDAGWFILTRRQDGVVVVEQDINSLQTFTVDKDTEFRKNRVIRVLDEIGNTASITFKKSYLGKVDNDDDGRKLYKADLISYMKKLQQIKAVTNFDSTTDVTVYAGEGIEDVVAVIGAQPVDSMEKLYMTVNVG